MVRREGAATISRSPRVACCSHAGPAALGTPFAWDTKALEHYLRGRSHPCFVFHRGTVLGVTPLLPSLSPSAALVLPERAARPGKALAKRRKSTRNPSVSRMEISSCSPTLRSKAAHTARGTCPAGDHDELCHRDLLQEITFNTRKLRKTQTGIFISVIKMITRFYQTNITIRL